MNFSDELWSDLESGNSLEHYGRKGMQWYKHIFGEYQDHAKYSSGSKDSSKSGSKTKSAPKSRNEERAKIKAAKKKEAEEKKAARDAARKELKRQKILSNPTKLYKHRNQFTYEEIRKAMEKFEWEQKLSGYSKARLRNGSDYIKTLTDYAVNGTKLYNACAEIANAMNKNGKQLPIIRSNQQQNQNNQNNRNRNNP